MAEGSTQLFISSEEEWTLIHSNFSGEELKAIEKNYRLIVLNAGCANEAIANSGLEVGPFTVAITGTQVAAYEKKGDNLEAFSEKIHPEVLEKVDTPFFTDVTNTYNGILGVALHGIVDGEATVVDDIQSVLSGENLVFNTVSLEEGLVQEMEENFGRDTTLKVLSTLKDAVQTGATSDGLHYYWVDGYKFTISKSGDVMHLVDVNSIYQDKNVRAAAFMKKIAESSDGDSWGKMEIKQLIGRDGVSTASVNRSELKANYPELDDYIDFRQSSAVGKAGKVAETFGSSFVDNFNYRKTFTSMVDDAKSGHWVSAGAKGLGMALDAVTVVVDIYDNCHDEYGNPDFTVANVQRGVTDAVVDLVAGSAAGAAGAAIGSCIVPPIGTAVGFFAGVVIGQVMEIDVDLDGDGEARSVVDVGKDLLDSFVDIVTFGATA